jgi:hypothetical protein
MSPQHVGSLKYSGSFVCCDKGVVDLGGCDFEDVQPKDAMVTTRNATKRADLVSKSNNITSTGLVHK